MSVCRFFAVALAVQALAASGAVVPEIAVPAMPAPQIDGVIGEAEWRGADEMRGFLNYKGKVAFPAAARFLVGRDGERLYFAAETACGPEGIRRRVMPRKGNAPAFVDDSFEFVFCEDVDAELPVFRHMIVNANGAATCDRRKGAKTEMWTVHGKFAVASAVTNGAWRFEFSVPLAEVGFEGGRTFGFRACRNWQGVGDSQYAVQTTWTTEDQGFFGVEGAPRVRFDAAAPVVKLLKMGGGPSESSYPVSLSVFNPGTAPRRISVRVKGAPVNSQPLALEEDFTLEPGKTRTVSGSGPVLNDESVDLSVDVTSDGSVAYRRRHSFVPNAAPVEFRLAGAKESGIALRFAYFPSFNRCRLAVDASTVKGLAGRKPVFSIVDSRGRALFSKELDVGKDGTFDDVVDIPDLKAATLSSGDGGYVARVEVPGIADSRKELAFRRDVFEWEGNKIGLSDTVPPPFTPVKRDGNRVSVVLRDHDIGEFGLWNQVVAAGKPLLARPMRIVMKDGARLPAGIDAKSLWDVDGMMDWTLVLPAGKCGPLSLEIPVRAERAPLYHSVADGLRFNPAGRIPAGTGRVWDSSIPNRVALLGTYLPYIWIGGPLRGIAVFGDNDRGWVLADGDKAPPCQEIVREADGTVVLRLNIVQKEVDLKEPRTVRIAFQATPVKPMLENWRSRSRGDLMAGAYIWGASQSGPWPWDETDTFFRKMGEARRTGKADMAFADKFADDYPYMWPKGSPRYEEKHKMLLTHYRSGLVRSVWSFKDPKKFIFYTNARGIEFGVKSGQTFADEWCRQQWTARPFNRESGHAYDLDPVKSYADCAVTWYKAMVETGAADGIYWDDVFPSGNFNLGVTDAYRAPGGEIQPTCGIFSMRSLVRRCAVMMAEIGKDPRDNWVHMTNTAMAPVSAFAGVHYDWEDTAGDLTIQERYSRDYVLATAIGRQMGCRVGVMGYFATKDPKSEKLRMLERTGTGACLANELEWPRVKTWRDVHGRLCEWGYRKPDTKVWNDFDEDVPFPVETKGPECAALAMSRGGEALVVVSDWSSGGEYSVRPDCAALGIRPGFEAYDFETGKPLAVEGGAVRLPIGKYDFAILRLK